MFLMQSVLVVREILFSAGFRMKLGMFGSARAGVISSSAGRKYERRYTVSATEQNDIKIFQRFCL